MKNDGKLLIAGLVFFMLMWLAVFAVNGWAQWAGQYDNDATPSGTGQDTLVVGFRVLDSLGNPIQYAAADSVWFVAFYPGGKEVSYTIRIAGLASNIYQYGGTGMNRNNFFAKVSDVDGTAVEGIYTYDLVAWDASLDLKTAHTGYFLVYEDAEWIARLDSNTATSRISIAAAETVYVTIWGDTVNQPGVGTYARWQKDLFFRDDTSSQKLDGFEQDWRRDRWPYDDPMVASEGAILCNFEDSTLWDFSASTGNADSTDFFEDETHYTQGNQGICLIAKGGETAVMRKKIFTTARKIHEGNYTLDVYIDPTYTHPCGFANMQQDDDTSGFYQIQVKWAIADSGFDHAYFYQYWSDTAIGVGWTPLICDFDGMDTSGAPALTNDWENFNIDSVSIEVTNRITTDENEVRVTVDDLRIGQRSREVAIIAFHDADTSVLSITGDNSPLEVMQKHRLKGVLWAIGPPQTNTQMDSAQLKIFIEDGWDVGGHSKTQPAGGLAGSNEATQRQQITQNLAWISRYISPKGAIFWHHPIDTYDSLGIRLLQEAGVKLAFGGKKTFGVNHPDLYSSSDAYYNYRMPYAPFHATAFDKEDMKRAADTLKMTGGFGCFAFHGFRSLASSGTACNIGHFEDIIAYMADTLNLNIWTLSQYYEYMRTDDARLVRIEEDTDNLQDSLDVANAKLDAMRDSLQYLTTASTSNLGLKDSAEAAIDNKFSFTEGSVQSDVVRWKANVVPTANVSGYPLVDVEYWDGTLATTADNGWVTATSVTVSDKTGFSLAAAGIDAFWDELSAGHSTSGSYGKLLTDYLDAAVSSRATLTVNDIWLRRADSTNADTSTMGHRVDLAADTSLYASVEEIANENYDTMYVHADDFKDGGGSSPWTAAGVDSAWDMITGWLKQYTGDSLFTLMGDVDDVLTKLGALGLYDSALTAFANTINDSNLARDVTADDYKAVITTLMTLAAINDSSLARNVTASDYKAVITGLMTLAAITDSNLARNVTADDYKAIVTGLMTLAAINDSSLARNATAASYMAVLTNLGLADSAEAGAGAALVTYDGLVPADAPTNWGDMAIAVTTGRVEANVREWLGVAVTADNSVPEVHVVDLDNAVFTSGHFSNADIFLQGVFDDNCLLPAHFHYSFFATSSDSVWNKGWIDVDDVPGSIGDSISTQAYIQGSASGLTAMDIWNVDWAAAFTASSMGDSLSTQAYIQGAASGLTAAQVAAAVWNKLRSDHAADGTFGGTVASDSVAIETIRIAIVAYLDEAISGIDDNPWDAVVRTLTANTNLNDPSAATIADSIWLALAEDYSVDGDTSTMASHASGTDSNAVYRMVLVAVNEIVYDSNLARYVVRENYRGGVATVDEQAIADLVWTDGVNIYKIARNATKDDYKDGVEADTVAILALAKNHPSDFTASAGDGVTPVRMYIYDKTNATAVAGAEITVKLASDQTVKVPSISSNAEGWASATLSTDNIYHVYGTATGYVFTEPACTLTVGAAADSLRDTVYVTAFDPGDPGDADLKRIYGWIKDAGDNPLVGAIVSLAMDVPGDTIPRGVGTEVTIYRTAVRDTTDADGYWSLDIFPEDGVTPRGISYHYKVTYNDKYLLSHRKQFTPTGTTSQAITEF